MNKRFFFIGALPRSRTAWLANLLTFGDSLCLHGGLLECEGHAERLPTLLQAKPHAVVGNSDPSMMVYPNFETIRAAFPASRWVFLIQDPKRSWERHRAAFPEVDVGQDFFEQLLRRIGTASASMPDTQRICLQETELQSFRVCDNICRHCTGRTLEFNRWKMLDKMTVVARKSRWIEQIPAELIEKVAAASL